MKKILIAASEAVPFIKTGGLADVIGALPKSFDKEKFDVRVIIPKYKCLDNMDEEQLRFLAECTVVLNWRHQYARIYQAEIDGIVYYLIDNEYYFSGDKPYEEIHLDAEKFAFFSKAILTVLPLIEFYPDIIHCNDWQTGLLPVFLKEQFDDEPYRNIKTVFTIHNMRFQGKWDIDAYKDITGLPDQCFVYEKLESYGSANPFKGGIVYADKVTTVSETYALEIQTSFGGEGLDGLMRYRKDDLIGIINGLDTVSYNPASDMALEFPFDQSNWKTEKIKNKILLQKELCMETVNESFMIGLVSRLTDQKGFDLVLEKLQELMSYSDIQIVLQGTGDPYYEQKLKEFAELYPNRMIVRIQYSENFARKIYGSADAFLMPSLFEPCGLSQLISLRYGTVPMVRATGGLKDTVSSCMNSTEGNGFLFEDFDSDAMLKMILDAYRLFKTDKKSWAAIVDRCLSQDYSWKKSAAKYEALYMDMICSCLE